MYIYVYRSCFRWSNEIDVQVEFHNVSLGRKEVYSVFFHSVNCLFEVLSSLFLDIPVCLEVDSKINYPKTLIELTGLEDDDHIG